MHNSRSSSFEGPWKFGQEIVCEGDYGRSDNRTVAIYFAGVVIDFCKAVARRVWNLRFIATLAKAPLCGIGEGGTKDEP